MLGKHFGWPFIRALLFAFACERVTVCVYVCVCALVTFCYIAHTHCCILIKANRCAALKAYKNQLNQNTTQQLRGFNDSASQIKCNYSGQRDDARELATKLIGSQQTRTQCPVTSGICGLCVMRNDREKESNRERESGSLLALSWQPQQSGQFAALMLGLVHGPVAHATCNVAQPKCGRTLLASNYN